MTRQGMSMNVLPSCKRVWRYETIAFDAKRARRDPRTLVASA
jgi:hypothetical protein